MEGSAEAEGVVGFDSLWGGAADFGAIDAGLVVIDDDEEMGADGRGGGGRAPERSRK